MSGTAGENGETPLTAGERAELERLRTLRQHRERRGIPWRSIGAGFLLVLGCLLAPISLLTVWVHNQVANTDRFVATASPLIQDPAVQTVITDRVANTIFSYVDVQAIATDAVHALGERGVPPNVTDRLQGLTGPLTNAVQNYVHGAVAQIVASPAVAQVWNQALRTTSEQMNQVLSGNSQSVVVSNGEVRLDLGPFITAAKQQLVAAGFGVAARVPDVHPTVPLTNATTLERGKGIYSLLGSVATWLPWVTLVFLAAGVYLARNHRHALVGAGLGVAGGMLVIAAALLIVRGILIGSVPANAAPATGSAYDILVRFLRDGLRTVLAVGLVLALAAFLSGPSVTAVSIRKGVANGIGWLRRGGARAGLRTGPVGPWVHRFRNALRIGLVAIAVLVFVLISQPSALTVLIIALVLLVCLGIVQFLDQPREDHPTSASAS
ncbi:hypothetical protein [Amycolatopsis panacis]|uniref:Integral membrane protein n=1 Tax=Amycolatopsis panacis TaxID=2340917 RepID=A0A419IBI2_9PSEU|nr:hypothetical protein [Amycolatopsis panacis]RJQ92310.1 hypothetical protein D5S19_00610 [Amycolatopsis panacis]